jgi:hypothetical protein
MKILMMMVVVAVAALALSGCSVRNAVPQTKITGSIAGRPFSVVTPKDSDIENLSIESQTNGTITVKLDKLTAKMSPDVIANTGVAQAQINASITDGLKQITGDLKEIAGALKAAAK